MPHKFNAARRDKIPKQTYRVSEWFGNGCSNPAIPPLCLDHWQLWGGTGGQKPHARCTHDDVFLMHHHLAIAV